MSDFLQAVTEAFRGLLDQGLLSVESSKYDDQAFGNAVVVLAGTNLRVRLLRDRGDVFAEAASALDPDNWYPLQRAIRAVGTSSPPEGLLTPVDAAKLVERHLKDLEKGLGSTCIDQTKTALADLERFATKRFMDRAKSS